MRLYPLSLKIAGRRCVVIGGGPVAERKVASLLECGAQVVVVAPEATPALKSWAAENRLRYLERAFEPADVSGAALAIAATDDTDVNTAVREAAARAGALVNVVDVPDLCDFYIPASVNRGKFQITVSTSGASPTLAKRVRIALEREFGPEYEAYTELLARLRRESQARIADRERRYRAEQLFLDSPALDMLAEGRRAEAEDILDECLRAAEQEAAK